MTGEINGAYPSYHMSVVRIGHEQITFTPETWDAVIAQIFVFGAPVLFRGLRKRDAPRKKADGLRRNASELARNVYGQLDASERAAFLAHVRLKQGRKEFDELRNEAYSMVGKMVNSGQGGEIAEKLFDAMLESSLDTAAQEREELIWHLYTAILAQFNKRVEVIRGRSSNQ